MTPYVGEIRMFAGNFPPVGWMFCEGAILPISENETLFNLIGTTYGGDGQSTFALPNLQSRVPIHMGTGGGDTYVLAEMAGTEQVTLTTQQMPVHNHAFLANSQLATEFSPIGKILAQPQTVDAYAVTAANVALNPQVVSGVGGNQPHENTQPYLCINFIISLFGVFPSPT